MLVVDDTLVDIWAFGQVPARTQRRPAELGYRALSDAKLKGVLK